MVKKYLRKNKLESKIAEKKNKKWLVEKTVVIYT